MNHRITKCTLPVILFVMTPPTATTAQTPTGSVLPIGTIVAYGGEFTDENVSEALGANSSVTQETVIK